MKTIAYYDSLSEAEMVRGRLQNEGIDAIVLNSESPFGAIAPMKPYVVVADEDLSRAREILGL